MASGGGHSPLGPAQAVVQAAGPWGWGLGSLVAQQCPCQTQHPPDLLEMPRSMGTWTQEQGQGAGEALVLLLGGLEYPRSNYSLPPLYIRKQESLEDANVEFCLHGCVFSSVFLAQKRQDPQVERGVCVRAYAHVTRGRGCVGSGKWMTAHIPIWFPRAVLPGVPRCSDS